jgi:hypothetical protein
MHDSCDNSTPKERYGLVLLELRAEDPQGSAAADRWNPRAGESAGVSPHPVVGAARLAPVCFALAYLAGIGWLAARAVRWLIAG